jgi:hypothetical protein
MHESLKTTPRYRTTFDILVKGLLDFAGNEPTARLQHTVEP